MKPAYIFAGLAAVLLLTRKPGGSDPGDTVDYLKIKQDLVNWMKAGGDGYESQVDFARIVNTQMTSAELVAVYTYVFQYIKKGMQPPAGSALYNQIVAISNKYNIFS